jgi:O-antigen/teichoic acid export membrane protein
MSPVVVREMSRRREGAGEIVGTAVIGKAGVALLCFLAAVAFLPLIKADRYLLKLVAILGLQLLSYPILTCVNIYRLDLKMIYPTGADLIRNALYLAGVWYVLSRPSLGLTHIMAVAVVLSFAMAVALYGLSRRRVRIVLCFDRALARTLLRSCIPLAVSQIAIIFYYRLDNIMLLQMKDEVAVGYYSMAFKIAEVFSYLPSAFMASVYPYMSRFWAEDEEKFLRATELSLRCLLVVALPIGIFLSLFPRAILSIVPGDYLPSADSLALLAWAEVFIFLNIVFYNAFNAMNRERLNLWTTLAMLGGNVLLNLILIPRYSHQGASLATVLTESMGFIVLGFALVKILGGRLDLRLILRALGVAAALALVLWLLWGGQEVTIWLAIAITAVSSAVYCGALVIFKVIDPREVTQFLKSPPDGV